MLDNPLTKYKSYQIFKYQNFDSSTQINGQRMFYGQSLLKGNGISIIKYLKENGYVTVNQCQYVKRSFLDRTKKNY